VENVFILGIIPGPGMPDVWEISHILDAFVTKMNAFRAPGQKIPTHHHPEGVLVQLRILPLIADLGAIRKIAGFLSHSATFFCSFCLIKSAEIESLDYETWTPRDGPTVKAQGRTWLFEKTTIKDREEWSTKTGVRWTPMHDISYWDPVKHCVLGFMHNVEGKAEHHLRILWGIGRKYHAEEELKEQRKYEEFSESDASEASDELTFLESDASMPLEDLMNSEYEGHSQSSATPTPQNPGTHLRNLFLSEESDEGDPDDADFTPPDPNFDPITGAFNFTPDQLAAIRACIKDVQLPTWVGRPPTNLGEASHGKLKAQELLTLFTVIFPLIIPQLWWEKSETAMKLLDNFYHFVGAINIIASYSTSDTMAEEYRVHFTQYRRGIQELWPRIDSLPNHHLAMHNPELLKFWGPLSVISEFPGERMNGELGKIKTNRRICKFIFPSVFSITKRH
jgi:hypothetical protein